MKTRTQTDMEMAARLVDEVAKTQDAETRKIFGGLCHSFPIMVRTCGLCQAVAFSEDKATVSTGTAKPRQKAHKLLLEHVAVLLNGPNQQLSPADRARGATVSEYMHDTLRILSAWVFWKRFAVSILKVQSAKDAKENTDV